MQRQKESVLETKEKMVDKCYCPEGQNICSYSHWFELITTPNCYNTEKRLLWRDI